MVTGRPDLEKVDEARLSRTARGSPAELLSADSGNRLIPAAEVVSATRVKHRVGLGRLVLVLRSDKKLRLTWLDIDPGGDFGRITAALEAALGPRLVIRDVSGTGPIH